MTLDDVDQVVKIERLSFPSPWSRLQFVQEVRQNPLSYPFVLRRQDSGRSRVVGFCVCWIVRDELHVNNIAVHPSCRRLGYGEMMMRYAIGFGEANRCRRVTLEVRVSNQKAIDLYAKLGFRIVGEVPNYYEVERENAYILLKDLQLS
jgi:ribosomal-protein-alanine N-acetyltransferase